MQQANVIPVARPSPPIAAPPQTVQAIVPTATPLEANSLHVAMPGSTLTLTSSERDLLIVKTRRAESFAVASAVIGVTGFIPIASQVASIWMGVLAILRIRKAKRYGLDARFKGWAILGLISSVIGLLGWVGMAIGAMFLSSTMGNSTDMLQGLIPALQ